MRFKQTTERLGMAKEVLASLQIFGDTVADGLDADQSAPAEGEVVFRYRMLFERLESDLVAVRSGIVTAEDAHVRNLVVHADQRSLHTEVTAGLYDQQVAVRQTLGGVYGPKHGFKLASFSGRTPQYGEDLLREVEHTIQLLRQPVGETPSTKVGGVNVDFGDMALDLETEKTGFEDVRAELERSRKAAKETRVRKNEAIAEFDRVFPWLAQTLESVFRLAGEHDLADQIRTSARRSHRRQDGDGAAEESGESSSEGSETEEPDSPPTESEESASPPTVA
ncbi:MAG: hypothetical protein GY719_35180 [bacterium]|nr:hypothetical protein [bacterium]